MIFPELISDSNSIFPLWFIGIFVFREYQIKRAEALVECSL